MRHFCRRRWVAVAGAIVWIVSAIAGAAAELAIRPAVQLDFTPVVSRVYQLQQTDDLGHWGSRDGFFLAGVSPDFRLESMAEARARSYRLVESPSRNVSALLEPIRAKHTLPGLAVVVVRSNLVVGIGAVGDRKWNVNEPVTLNDKWHHGSITKSMTATLAAVLVEAGRVEWTTRLADVFPAQAAAMHPQWRTVTLEQLLAHRAGAPDSDWLNQKGIWPRIWAYGGTAREARGYLLRQVTVLPPQATPGTQFIYSNAGYAFAGAMLEQIMDQAWEVLITERLFHPLGMSSAGFGVPATPRYIDQPWGHTWVNGAPLPIAPGTDADNPPAIGPAGTVHCTALDLAKYVALHVAGARGATGLLLPATAFTKLHGDPDGDGYALGWNVSTRPWAGGRTLSHTGSNLQWYTNIWIAPAKDWGCLVLTNFGGDQAFAATDEVVAAMIGQFL